MSSPQHDMSARALVGVAFGIAAGLLASSLLSVGNAPPSDSDCLPDIAASESQHPPGALSAGRRSDGGTIAALDDGGNLASGETRPRRRVSGPTVGDRGSIGVETPRGKPSPEAPPELGLALEPDMVQDIVDRSYEAAAEMERAMQEAGAPPDLVEAVDAMAKASADEFAGSVSDGDTTSAITQEYVSPEDVAYQAEASLSEDGAPEVMIEHVVQSLLTPPEEPVPPPDDPRQLEAGDFTQ